MSKKSKVKNSILRTSKRKVSQYSRMLRPLRGLQKAKKLRAAVIGVGSMGRQHARNYHEIENVDLVGISDIDEKAGKELAEKHNTRFFKDYREMLKTAKPDIVSIAVPTRWHYQVALDTINSRVHLLIEKPISHNLDEAKDIIEAARKKGVKLTVGHIERFNPAVVRLKELIKEGKLGTIVSIMARRTGIIPNRIKDANVIIDIGVHDIDLINFLLEKKPSNIYASGGRAILRKHEDYADIFLEYPASNDGLRVTGHIQVNWLTPVKIRKLNITGTKAYAVLNLVTQDLVLFDTDYTHEYDDFEDFVGKFKESTGVKVPVGVKEPLRLQLERFIESVLSDAEVYVSGEDALWALRLAHIATEHIRIKDNRV